MTNNIDSHELLEMKAQLRLLTQKLEQEAIVNEQLIRRSMKDKAYKLRRRIIEESTICLIMIPFFIWILPQFTKISMHFCLFSAAFMALAVCYNYYMYRQFHPKIFTEGNLIDAQMDLLHRSPFPNGFHTVVYFREDTVLPRRTSEDSANKWQHRFPYRRHLRHLPTDEDNSHHR